MLELDREYTDGELVDILTDGDIRNFKGDIDFLNFLLAYGFSKANESVRKYNVSNIMMQLDMYGLLGKDLYKIYEACNKDKYEFIKTCDAIGVRELFHMLEENTIKRNLELDNPVKFVDDNIVLGNGKKPIYNYNEDTKWLPSKYGIDIAKEYEDYEELAYEMERSLRKRINEVLRKQGNTNLLEERPPYKEMLEKEKQERESRMIPKDYNINVNNLYYGTRTFENNRMINRAMLFFENNNVGIGRYASFRDIPNGNYLLIDENGNIEKDTYGKKDKNEKRRVHIIRVMQMINNFLAENEKDGIASAETMEFFYNLRQYLNDRGYIQVDELQEFEPIFKAVYEKMFGPISSNNDIDSALDDRNYSL